MHPADRYEDQRLARRRRRGDRRARELLIERHIPLARNLAYRYHHGREPLDDLIQVAMVGLVKSADRWDPDRGTAFSTYAVPVILGELRRHFRDATWFVRPPRRLQELWLSVRAARQALGSELGRPPTVPEIADRLQREVGEVMEALQAADGRSASWLDAPTDDDQDHQATVGETVAVTDSGYGEAEARIAVEQLLPLLDRRTRDIMRLRFQDGLPQSQIAERAGVSQMQISRAIRSGVTKLYAEGFGSL